MPSFSQHLEETCEFIKQAHPDAPSYITDEKRVEEARRVERCVELLGEYELFGDRHGLGRVANVSLVPPLGKLVGARNVRSLSEDEIASYLSAINHAAAVGYMNGIQAQGPDADDAPAETDLEAIWQLWVVRLWQSEVLAQYGMAESRQDIMRQEGEQAFMGRLQQAGLLPMVRKRMRYQNLGKYYGQAGCMLRLFQIAGLEDQAGRDWRQVVNRWPMASPGRG